MNHDNILQYSVHNRVVTLTLNRPQARNAFNAALRQALSAAIERALADQQVRLLLIAANGPVFSAGGDLAELQQPGFLPQQQLEQDYKPLLLQIAHAPKPVIGVIQGTAAGIGASLAMACDLSLMADNASLYLPFSQLGLIADGGACWQLLQAAGRQRAYEAIISGARLSATQCQTLGLCNRVVASELLLSEAQAWAGQLAASAPLTLRYAKQALQRVGGMNLADAISYEAALQNYCMRSRDSAEAFRAVSEKRAPVFIGE